MELHDLPDIKRSCQRTLLRLYKDANAGHIASSLSCLDILLYIHFNQMKPGDRFILSKGHAAAALYTVLNKTGCIPDETLDTFYKDGTRLAAHPPCSGCLDGITFGTGSLGHGMSLAVGTALSARFTGRQFKVYCVLSDGDMNSGATWEAIMFAAQHRLDNLVAVVDYNRIQGFGDAKDVIDLEPLEEKLTAFGFDVSVAEYGNEFESLAYAFSSVCSGASGRPRCIIAKTAKGSGVSFMENKMEWHYLPMTDEQYKDALKGLDEL